VIMLNDLVSIVVSTRNNRATITHVLRSAKEFTRKYSAELIVVEGGSSDGTYDAISRFMSENKGYFYRTLLLRDPGVSLSYARYLGFNHSLGEFVVFLDGDTILHPEFTENFGRRVLRDKSYDVIASHYLILKLDYYTGIFDLLVNVRTENPMDTSKPDLLPPARIFSRRSLIDIHGYPVLSKYFSEDRLATTLAVMKGYKYAYMRELKIIKVDEPSLASYLKKHVRYGEGFKKDLTTGGKSLLRNYIVTRRIMYLNLVLPVVSAMYALRAHRLYPGIKLRDTLSVFIMKHTIDLGTLLGELKSMLTT